MKKEETGLNLRFGIICSLEEFDEICESKEG